MLKAKEEYDTAEPLRRRALAIREKVLGPEHSDMALSLNNLASLLEHKGDYETAETLYRRALAIDEKALGPEHPQTAGVVSNLAPLLREQKGDYKNAEPLLRRALAINEKALGPEHPQTATSLHNLALLLTDKGDYENAEPLLRRALAINEKVLGLEHPQTAVFLNNLSELLEARRRGVRARRGRGSRDTMLKINGKKIVFAGRFKQTTRAEALRIARKLGALTIGSLDASANFLVAGAGADSKVKDAKKRGVRVIDEDAWMKIVEASPRAKQTELSIWGWGIDVECAKLTKRKADRIIRKGISYDELSKLLESCTSGPTDCSLTVDDGVVREIVAEPEPEPFKWGEKNTYFLVREETQKGQWGKLLIDGGFDEQKFSVSMETNDLNGVAWTIIWIDYDGKEFEFIGTETKVGPDFYIIKPDGKKEDFEIIDE